MRRPLVRPPVVLLLLLVMTIAACGGPSTPSSSGTVDQPSTVAPTADGTGSAGATPTTATGSTPSPTASVSRTISPSPSPSPTAARDVLPIPDVTPKGVVAPPPGSGLTRYAGQRLTWGACSGGLQCATVLVPLDYAHPDDRAITLALARWPATATPRLGTLFLNPGGPGGSGIGFLRSFSPKGLEAYDIVGWDPRGVGQSTPVECFGTADLDRFLATDTSPDNAAETEELASENRALGASCLQHSGALLAHVSTEETVRDLDLLRGLVGDQKLNYLGGSYGTYIGAVYAQLFPHRVGRLVLDGAVDISHHETVSQTQGFERALDNYATWCAQRHCGLGSSRAAVLRSITGLWDRLDSHPIRVGDRLLTQSLGVTGVLVLLYEDQRAWTLLTQALLRAENGQGDYLLALADAYNQRGRDGRYGQIIYAFPAIRCLDTPDDGVAGAERDAAAADKKAPAIGRFTGPDLTCPTWPVAARPQLPTLTGAGAAPILVVGTTGDPATPYESAVAMARQLKSGALLTYVGDGHTAYGRGSACIDQTVQAYLAKGVVPADGKRCT